MTMESNAREEVAAGPEQGAIGPEQGAIGPEQGAIGPELIVLFGDELDEIGAARIGVHVVGGAKVSARDMATMLLSAAVADLLERGVGTLTESEVKKLFRTRRTLTMQCSDHAGAGLTGAVANATREGMPLDDLALHLIGGRVSAPEMALIAIAKSQLEHTGAVVRVQEKGLRRIGGKLGMSPFELDDAAAESLRRQWQELRRRWETWRERDPALAKRLLDGCRSSIVAATEAID